MAFSFMSAAGGAPSAGSGYFQGRLCLGGNVGKFRQSVVDRLALRQKLVAAAGNAGKQQREAVRAA